MRGICVILCQFRDDARGSISILAGFLIVSVVGVSALALEYGHGLLQKTENQRAADLAAYAGGLVYNSTGSTDSATSAAANVAALNGMTCSSCASYVSSPSGDGNHAIEVSVTTNLPLHLARVLTSNTTLPVTATAYAEIINSAPGCIIALSPGGTGISLSGGTHVNANNCAVASDATVNPDVTLAGGANLVVKALDYASAYNVQGGSAIGKPGGGSPIYSNVAIPDPLNGNSAVSTAAAHIGLNSSGSCAGTTGTVCAITSPSAPSVTIPTGNAVSFTKTGVTGLPAACSDTYDFTNKIYTVNCTGTATFGTITVNKVTVVIPTSSGNTYNFDQSWPISGVTLSGSGGTYGFGAGFTTSGTQSFPTGTYNVVGSIAIGNGATSTFSAGTYNVTTGITMGGGSTATFAAGTFNLGTASCSGTNGYSICNTGTSLIFTGPDTFVLAGGVYNGGGASLALGSGSSANSYNIGVANDTYSLNAGTSKIMTLGDATGSGDIFQTAGTITSGGGSCMTIPATSAHDINGSINTAGGIVLGSGIYTVKGYVALGNSGGGDVSNCPTTGTTTGLTALNVTLVIGGTSTVSCGGTTSAVCFGAGYNTVDITAPSSGITANLAVIGPQTSTNTAAAAFTTGATNTRISGAFYFPHGAITMSGAASLHDTVDTGACLELIGSQVTLAGGSATGSSCTGLGGSGSGISVSLVQ